MEWREGAAIAGALVGGRLGKALQIPNERELRKDRNKAIAKSGASNGARNFPTDIWRNESDGGI